MSLIGIPIWCLVNSGILIKFSDRNTWNLKRNRNSTSDGGPRYWNQNQKYQPRALQSNCTLSENFEMPLAVAPAMPNFDPGGWIFTVIHRPVCQLVWVLQAMKYILWDRLTSPKPFQLSMWLLSYHNPPLHQGNQSPFRPSNPWQRWHVQLCVSMALDAPIIHAPTGFDASWLTYSMSYGGMLIPVTQMTWWMCSYHSSLFCIVNSIKWWSLWVGTARRYPFSQFLFDCRVWTKSPQLHVGM